MDHSALLGEGAFGKVYRATVNGTGEALAAKYYACGKEYTIEREVNMSTIA